MYIVIISNKFSSKKLYVIQPKIISTNILITI